MSNNFDCSRFLCVLWSATCNVFVCNIWKVRKLLYGGVDLISWVSTTRLKHLGFPFFLPETLTPSLISPVSHLIILYSEGKLPIYSMSTIYQALYISILKASVLERSNHLIFKTKKTHSRRWSDQVNTLVGGEGWQGAWSKWSTPPRILLLPAILYLLFSLCVPLPESGILNLECCSHHDPSLPLILTSSPAFFLELILATVGHSY